MLGRIDRTAEEPPAAGFPHYADPSSGEWSRSPFGDWTGGFWNGELWLAAQVTGDSRYARLGREWALALRPRAKSETVFYTEVATSMVDALIDGHLTGMDEEDNRPQGILTDGCYNRQVGLATANELIWGDYFLLEALAVLEGHLNSEEV
jgi:hypothetical protein